MAKVTVKFLKDTNGTAAGVEKRLPIHVAQSLAERGIVSMGEVPLPDQGEEKPPVTDSETPSSEGESGKPVQNPEPTAETQQPEEPAAEKQPEEGNGTAAGVEKEEKGGKGRKTKEEKQAAETK